MKPSRYTFPALILIGLFLFLNLSGAVSTAQAQQVQVNAADPPATEQGTINLNVKVTGKGFKNGAKAKWFVTGTTDPGGISVNSTTFVNSTELTANITVADTAVIANFDIQVLNSDGRGGKGTELFAVTPHGGGTAGCPALIPPPASDTKCYAALPGCLDLTFGSNGLVTTDTSGPNYQGDYAEALLIQNDGKIVAAGYANNAVNGTGTDFVVVRYNTDGSLDTSFGDPDPLNPPFRLGYVRTPFTTGTDFGHAALLQPDGKIVLGGNASPGTWAVARYNTDGTLDASFGSGGKETLSITAAAVRAMAVQSDGRLVLVGEPNFTIMRLNQDGSPDSSFGVGGKLTVNPSSLKRGRGHAWSVAIQRTPAVIGEERILVGGWSDYSSTATVFTMMRFKPTGATDTTFGSSGHVYSNFLGFGDQIRQLAVDSNNRIIAAGISNAANFSCGSYVTDLAVARYTQDGTLDPSFSGDGRQTADIYGGAETLFNGLAIQSDGKIVIAGAGVSSDITVRDFALVRFNSDGTPDSSFGYLGTGVVTTDFFGTSDQGLAIALQPSDGKIVFAGGVGGAIGLARYWP
jgi:uncharacterized delta-60 repeat protein